MGGGIVLWPDRALVLSRLGRVAPHAHHASALLMGVDGSFGFRARGDERWHGVRRLFISAGCLHELDVGSTAVAVLFLAPGRADHDRFCRRHEIPPLAPFHELTGWPDPPLRELWEGEMSREDLQAWLRAIVDEPPARFCAESRVERVARRIRAQVDLGFTLETLARDARLSPSRLAHLFRVRAGLTPQQLRSWYRMHTVGREVAEGRRLTDAAHTAGFVDSAHLSRSFRKLFGLPPSRVLGAGRLQLEGS